MFKSSLYSLNLAKPSHLRIIAMDLLGRLPGNSTENRLRATMQWLCAAHDAGGRSGVSAGYSLVYGWLPCYPETTGYIIPTFFDYSHLSKSDEFHNRAIRMADWEIDVQLPTGAVQAGVYRRGSGDRRPAVFNTGQVIFGWTRAFLETKNDKYLSAAVRAADWLVNIQRPDGSWAEKAPETETDVHAYDARTAWALLELSQYVVDVRYQKAAIKNFEWTLQQQTENGWFCNNAFFVSKDKWSMTFTHTIAYVLEGLQGGFEHLKDPRYLDAIKKTSDRLMTIFESKKTLDGDFDEKWNPSRLYSCLTGNAQIAGVWLRLYRLTHESSYLNAARRLNDVVGYTQDLRSRNNGIRGGIKGSQPIYATYTPYTFVNWAAKFFADSLMLEERLMIR